VLFVYSVSTIGVALTVILTSVSPLLTQIFARALGKESPSPRDFVGGILIVAALVLAVSL
jgi:drug/metabolite transporter, DME family